MKIYFRALHGPSDWGWVIQQLPVLRVEDTSGIMAINEETNTTIGAVVFDNWTANSVQAHFIITDPMLLRHGFLEEVADYVFNVADRKYMYGMVPGNNDKALRLNKHLGFTEILRLPDAYADGIDYVVVELKKENCKHIPVVELPELRTG